MSLWAVARLNVNKLAAEDKGAVMAWVTSLGQDPNKLWPVISVSQDELDRSYRLHLSRYVLDVDGNKQIDHAADHMWTEPVVIPIAELPAWLLPAYSRHLAEQNGA